MSALLEKTLSAIAKENHHAVPVLEKYQLDFCCKGKRTLADACADKLLDANEISCELESAFNKNKDPRLSFDAMTVDQLISYVLLHHHFYVKQVMPVIIAHLEKVEYKHGDRYPYINKVLTLFREISCEMITHMQKEEQVLFPRMKEVEINYISKKANSRPANYIKGPVAVLENEHEHAGEIMEQIRELTNDYTAPADACTTHQVTINELKGFEEDLHRHVHIENNILFPLANKMFRETMSLA